MLDFTRRSFLKILAAIPVAGVIARRKMESEKFTRPILVYDQERGFIPLSAPDYPYLVMVVNENNQVEWRSQSSLEG